MNPDIDRFYRTLVRETSDAIVYADAEGRISFWNKGAEQIFGFAASEAIGKTLDIIIPENLRKRHWDGYEETVRTGKTALWRRRLARGPGIAKGRRTHFSGVHHSPVSGPARSDFGIAATLRDVTKRFEE